VGLFILSYPLFGSSRFERVEVHAWLGAQSRDVNLKGAATTSKIVVLTRLIAAIDEGRHSLESLKERAGGEQPPSTRSMRRYLSTLAAAGFPWFFDRQSGTYRFQSGFSMRRIELSGRELQGLIALRGIAQSLGGTIGASIDDVTRKLVGVADRQASFAASKPSVLLQMTDVDLEGDRTVIFELLQRAQRESQSVRFGYVDKGGKRSQRHVDPYGFVVSGGRVYVVAHDRGRGAMRVFALDAIATPQIAPARFTMPANFDIEEFASSSISGIMRTEDPIAVTIRFAPLVARAAKADAIVRDRTITDRPGGGVEITYVVTDPGELTRWSLRWGPEAEVIAPPVVRDAARALIAEIAKKYS
jgi:predicted DNA-binding transcriptional regulator YafY